MQWRSLVGTMGLGPSPNFFYINLYIIYFFLNTLKYFNIFIILKNFIHLYKSVSIFNFFIIDF